MYWFIRCYVKLMNWNKPLLYILSVLSSVPIPWKWWRTIHISSFDEWCKIHWVQTLVTICKFSLYKLRIRCCSSLYALHWFCPLLISTTYCSTFLYFFISFRVMTWWFMIYSPYFFYYVQLWGFAHPSPFHG